MEGCDRTADTGHPEGEKHPDRVRRRAHDVIDQIVGSEGHGQLRSEMTIAERAVVSLLERKLAAASPSPRSYGERVGVRGCIRVHGKSWTRGKSPSPGIQASLEFRPL